jgi:hypothetical protein
MTMADNNLKILEDYIDRILETKAAEILAALDLHEYEDPETGKKEEVWDAFVMYNPVEKEVFDLELSRFALADEDTLTQSLESDEGKEIWRIWTDGSFRYEHVEGEKVAEVEVAIIAFLPALAFEGYYDRNR